MTDQYYGDASLMGTRSDLAAFLRQHRKVLRLVRSDKWQCLGGGDVHTFLSLVGGKPFTYAGGGKSRIMDWQITPF